MSNPKDPTSLLGNEDPRGRVQDARPLDRPFYDRNLSGGGAAGEAGEIREYHRHRTMFWELFADWFRPDPEDSAGSSPFRKWYQAYYNGQSAKEHLTWWPGYGSPTEAFPFDDCEDMKALKHAPGLNVPPEHGDNKEKPDVKEKDLEFGHKAFDLTQEAFGAARGCYEVWTDVFVDITDAFRGGYQNGDMRWIFKTPLNEEYKYVGNLHEHLYGLKNGWAWTAIQGTKEFQCATLGGYEFGRLIDLGSYIDYKGEHADYHPSDPDGEGAFKGDVADVDTKNHRFGNWVDFGIVDKTYAGPLTDDEARAPAETDADYNDDGSYKTGTHHGVLSETKVGYGSPGEADVTYTKEHKTNKRIFSWTEVAGYTAEEVIKDGKFKSEVCVGPTIKIEDHINTDDHPAEVWSMVSMGPSDAPTYTREERLTATAMHTVLHGNDHESCYGHKSDMLLGTSHSFTLGETDELYIGGRFELIASVGIEAWIGGKLEIALGPVKEIKVTNKKELTAAKKYIGVKVDRLLSKIGDWVVGPIDLKGMVINIG